MGPNFARSLCRMSQPSPGSPHIGERRTDSGFGLLRRLPTTACQPSHRLQHLHNISTVSNEVRLAVEWHASSVKESTASEVDHDEAGLCGSGDRT